MEWQKNKYLVTDDKSQLQLDVIYRLLSETYWSNRRPWSVVERIVCNSLCLGLFHENKQIGFGRAVTDSVTFTWVSDVVIASDYRGKGLGNWMMECLTGHPVVKGTQMVLQTRDAQGLYERFGFSKNSALMSTNADSLGTPTK